MNKYIEATFDSRCSECGIINEVKIDIVNEKYIADLNTRAETAEARVKELEDRGVISIHELEKIVVSASNGVLDFGGASNSIAKAINEALKDTP